MHDSQPPATMPVTMVRVQIAGRMTRQGVAGVSWVLVDADTTPNATPVATSMALIGQSPDAAHGRSLRAQVLRTLLGWAALAVGLLVAVLAGFGVLGAPVSGPWRAPQTGAAQLDRSAMQVAALVTAAQRDQEAA